MVLPLVLTFPYLCISPWPPNEVMPEKPYIHKPKQGQEGKSKEKETLTLTTSLVCWDELSVNSLYRRRIHDV